ncbi:MAG: alpha/beta fold hydrolase [Bryobacteraceae bacterium]
MPPVCGFLHEPDAPLGRGLVLTHGAGSNAQAPLLVAVAEAFAAAEITVLRCDLPFRQTRPHGPPFPAAAAQDRAGLKRAVALLRERLPGDIYVGGHSYGGRQSTILASSEPDLAAGLLLFSYPLHPPRKPADLRTGHFPLLATPSLFIHGTRDPFGSLEEMQAALALVRGRHELMGVEGAGHDLGGKGSAGRIAELALNAFRQFF